MKPRKKQTLMLLSVLLLVALSFGGILLSRPPQRGRGRPDPSSVNQPYEGVVASRGKQGGLFALRSSGVSTQPIVEATKGFLDSLTDAQRERTMFEVDDKEWRMWDNRHFYKRQGVGFDEMTEEQRTAAFAMMQQSLSAKGLKKTQDIMKLNGTLAELANNFDEYGEWLYWVTVMGEPSTKEPWGWQLDGHHVIINYFVLGDQVVMSPVFMGSEPVTAQSGKFKGTQVMQDEQDKGLQLMQALTAEQQGVAILMQDKPGNNNLAEAYKDNLTLDYAGISADKLDDGQREKLLVLIAEYVNNMREGHAQVRMEEVEKHLDETYFAWIGGVSEESTYYYRIHSPVILIEFDHQRRVAPFRSREPSRDHIHTVVRTPNGNDYGKDLLRQHYERHPH